MSSKLQYLIVLFLMFGLVSTATAGINWLDTTGNHKWSDGANWAGGSVPTGGGNPSIGAGLCNIDPTMVGANKAVCNALYGPRGGAILNVDGGELAAGSGIWIADGAGTGTLNVTNGGTVSSGGDRFRVGYAGDGTLYVDNGTVTAVRLQLGILGGSTGQATIGSGTVTVGTGGTQIGAAGSGTVTLNTGGTLSSGGHVDVGYDGGAGAVNIAGGTLQATTGNIRVGNYGAGASTLTMSAGTINSASYLYIGMDDSGSGTVTISGGDVDIAGWLVLGNASVAPGTLDLIGGTMEADTLLIRNEYSHLDIEAGTLTLVGDDRTRVEGYVGNGWLSGYGFADWDHVQMDYNTINPGYTTVWAIPEPATMLMLGLGSLALLRRKRSH